MTHVWHVLCCYYRSTRTVKKTDRTGARCPYTWTVPTRDILVPGQYRYEIFLCQVSTDARYCCTRTSRHSTRRSLASSPRPGPSLLLCAARGTTLKPHNKNNGLSVVWTTRNAQREEQYSLRHKTTDSQSSLALLLLFVRRDGIVLHKLLP